MRPPNSAALLAGKLLTLFYHLEIIRQQKSCDYTTVSACMDVTWVVIRMPRLSYRKS